VAHLACLPSHSLLAAADGKCCVVLFSFAGLARAGAQGARMMMTSVLKVRPGARPCALGWAPL